MSEYRSMNPHRIPSWRRSVNILACVNCVVQASTMNAEQMVKDSGRGPASKIAPVYSPLLSGSWSLSAEKSITFNIFSGFPWESNDLCFRSRFLVKAFLPSIGSPFPGLLVSVGWRLPKTTMAERRRRNKVEGSFMTFSQVFKADCSRWSRQLRIWQWSALTSYKRLVFGGLIGFSAPLNYKYMALDYVTLNIISSG